MTPSYKNKLNKGTLKEHIGCPFDDCGSSDAMAVYVQADGNEDGTCYSCGRYSKTPYGAIEHPKPATTGMTRQSYTSTQAGTNSASSSDWAAITLEEGLTHPVRRLGDRGIDRATAEHFGVRVGVSSTDGETPIYTLFPRHRDDDQVGWKKTTADKKISSTGGTEVDLFGMSLCKEGGKRIWITEGEFDALAVYQALTVDSNISWSPDVVSLPDGCKSTAKSIARSLDKLNKFDEVVLVFDNDPAGKEAVKVACKMLAGKVSVVSLPMKDANEMLLAGRTVDLKWQCLSHAKKYQPDGILNAKDLYGRYKDNTETFSYPYPSHMQKLNEMTYGVRAGSIVIITSGSGMGKTQLMRELFYHFLQTTDVKIAGMFLEEDVGDTLSGLIALDVNKRITLPDVKISEEDEAAAFERLFGAGRISLYDFFGGMDDDSLMSKLKYFAVTGHKFIFLDHFSIIVSEYAAEGGERERIDTLMSKLAKFVKEFGIVLFMVVHLRKTDGKKSFEEGGRPSLDDLRGSGTLKQYTWDVLGLSRNQQHPDSAAANTTEVSVLKCRFTGRTGQADFLAFDQVTGRMNTVEEPVNYHSKSGTSKRPMGSNEY